MKAEKGCAVCGNLIHQPTTGRRREFCSHACRQLAYRRRQDGQPARIARATSEAVDLLNQIFRHAASKR
jgi:endogenous inhibitor of DNA gyrase (YacG/DUF329 family)